MRPNLVFVLVDQLRLQSCGYAGDPRARTPTLDRLAKSGMSFSNAVSSSPATRTMLLGAATMRPIIDKLHPGTSFVSRPRFSKLTYAGQKKLSRLPRRSAIVAFSADVVYA